jgi:hypothetical protein
MIGCYGQELASHCPFIETKIAEMETHVKDWVQPKQYRYLRGQKRFYVKIIKIVYNIFKHGMHHLFEKGLI